jgi:hypothetical protein
MLTTDQKGGIAEAAVAWHATKLGIEVYRPIAKGGRQRQLVTWADDFDFAARLSRYGAIAQLGERVHGMHEVAGSSPAGSTLFRA